MLDDPEFTLPSLPSSRRKPGEDPFLARIVARGGPRILEVIKQGKAARQEMLGKKAAEQEAAAQEAAAQAAAQEAAALEATPQEADIAEEVKTDVPD